LCSVLYIINCSIALLLLDIVLSVLLRFRASWLPLWYRPSNSSYHVCYILILTMHIHIYLLRIIPVQTSISAIIITSNIRNLIHALILITIQLSKPIARFVLPPFNCITGCMTSAWTYQCYVCSFNNFGYVAFLLWKCIAILFI
jgi:hypothetical protein